MSSSLVSDLIPTMKKGKKEGTKGKEGKEKKYTDEEKQLADTYQMKTGIEHVLIVPDTYIGSIEKTQKELYIYDDETDKMIERNIEYIPGLYKIFDEALVNARDHIIRMKRKIEDEFTNEKKSNSKLVSAIHIDITDDGTICVMNDGDGIPIVMHPEYNIWIPEVIFANLRSGANFNKDDNDIIGGKNGYGVKLAFIWSSNASIETIDHVRGLHYLQEINKNMYEICPPTIKKVPKSTKPFTKITFHPDYTRFGIPTGLSSEFRALLKKRAYDISAISDASVKVHYNGNLIPIKNFQQYIDCYVGTKTEAVRIYEENGERWEYAIALSKTEEFQHVSFVNGIHTIKGGTHVQYILDQIVKKICALILQKKKIEVKPTTIKEQLILFLRCDIVRPSFDSQSKEYMNTNVKNFGSKCDVSDKFIEKIAKMGIMETACALTNAKQLTTIAKTTDGTKKRTITGIPKLIDATYAGTAKSRDCILILCEGDSAKTGILSGLPALSAEENKYIGVYPLKGKMMNVRKETAQKIAKNTEITELKEIMGLKMGANYTEDTLIQLRYGKIVILCDSDVDGSHIKGLCINLFHSQWPSLTRIPGFLHFMNTPILKAFKGTQQQLFYNQGEYEDWKTENPTTHHTWTIKYYKGLGTSKKDEWMDYFTNKKFIEYMHTGNISDNKIDMVFNNSPNERKEWLGTYDRSLYLDTRLPKVSYEDFIQREFIHFSSYDNIRSIPNIMDGLKPSLRKILFCAFKRNLVSEIKVAQLSGYVSEHAEYHHGEVSLNEAIIGMAQNFLGSNNINLLLPNGQFGSRILGGEDHSAARYIFTCLNSLTRILYPKVDDSILHYLEDDGKMIEPLYYVPILPMILINGTSGIGTGYSTNICCYHPLDILSYLRHQLQLKPEKAKTIKFVPYYEGFKGIIKEITETQFLVKGTYTKINEDTILVSELPIGFWTQNFKEHLEDLINMSSNKSTEKEKDKEKNNKNTNLVLEFDFVKSDIVVEFTIKFAKGQLTVLEKQKTEYIDCNGVDKLLKLYTTISTTNMHLFNSKDKLMKYLSVYEIIDEYYGVRLDHYQKRKTSLISMYENDLVKISNRARFILENVEEIIDIRRKKVNEIYALLDERKYTRIDGKFDYLTDMKIISFSQEKITDLLKEKEDKESELKYIREISIETLWLKELDAFESAYKEYVEDRKNVELTNTKKTAKTVIPTKKSSLKK